MLDIAVMVKALDDVMASYVEDGILMLNDTYGRGLKVMVLKEETRSPG